MEHGLPRRTVTMTPKTPLWISLSTGLPLLAMVASLLLALDFSSRIEGAICSIESSCTVSGWRNEAAIESALSRSADIQRLRTGRTTALVAGCVSLALSSVFAMIGMSDRKRKTELLGSLASEWKEEKSSEIRGFISLHVGTLAQKRSELMVANAYGVVDETAWQQELVYFINRVLRQHCRVDADIFSFIELRAMVEKQISMLG